MFLVLCLSLQIMSGPSNNFLQINQLNEKELGTQNSSKVPASNNLEATRLS